MGADTVTIPTYIRTKYLENGKSKPCFHQNLFEKIPISFLMIPKLINLAPAVF